MIGIKQSKILAWLCCLLLLLSACEKKVTVTDSHQHVIALSSKHQWLIVNYWATWCQPCLTEMPELNAFYQKHKQQVLVIGVNFDGISDEKINRFAKKLGIDFPLTAHFPLAHYGIKAIPTLPATFIISPQGKKVLALYGPQTAEKLEQKMLEQK